MSKQCKPATLVEGHTLHDQAVFLRNAMVQNGFSGGRMYTLVPVFGGGGFEHEWRAYIDGARKNGMRVQVAMRHHQARGQVMWTYTIQAGLCKCTRRVLGDSDRRVISKAVRELRALMRR